MVLKRPKPGTVLELDGPERNGAGWEAERELTLTEGDFGRTWLVLRSPWFGTLSRRACLWLWWDAAAAAAVAWPPAAAAWPPCAVWTVCR